MIRGVIFDCFGVLYEGSLEYLASLVPPGRREAVYEVNRAADYGYISYEEYLKSMAELIGTGPEDIDRIAQERFVRNDPLVDFARSLNPHYKTALLSNVGHSIIETLFTDQELSELFDAVVLSGEVGMVKPYPEIYELTASRLGLLPEECVMIDDLPKNTEGAERIGMKGLVYSSVRQLEADLGILTGAENPHA